VLEGIRRMDPHVVYRHLPPVSTTVARDADRQAVARELSLTSSERRFLAALPNRFTLTESLDSGAFAPELTVKGLPGLLSVGLPEPVGSLSKEAGSPEPVGAATS
jgi:hypothetical protein